MPPLELVRLTELMRRTAGSPAVTIGLIDGPVFLQHPDLAQVYVRSFPLRESRSAGDGTCTKPDSAECRHGTLVAGVLSAKRGSLAPAICPGCTLLIRPLFSEQAVENGEEPGASPLELATAIHDCLDSGARVINLSVALSQLSCQTNRHLEDSLTRALRRNVIVIAAAGNQGGLGSTAITRHPWVIPVVGCDAGGSPLNESNLGSSIGRRGLRAPGDSITSLSGTGGFLTSGGTSIATPFVTGTVALLWSAFPSATAAQIRQAVCSIPRRRPATVVPPLLNAEAAYKAMESRAA